MRKNIICFLVIFSFINSFFSCGYFSYGYKRNNVIVEGYYSGVDAQNSLISCEISISRISKNELLNANGINVLEDGINGEFYSLNCVVMLPNNKTQIINFINLKDAYNGAKGTPISYVDDNYNYITPHTSLNKEILPSQKCYYAINLNSYDFYLFAYLYFVED